MRLAVYIDDTFKQDTQGASGESSVVRFILGMRPLLDDLVIIGRLDPEPGRSHYGLGPGVRFAGLPFYRSLANPREVAASSWGSLRVFWHELDSVDTVWVLGPYIHAIAFALLALARRRRVVLGLRQDFPRYIRSRRPGVRWMHHAADALEGAFHLLSRWLPIAVVGKDLALRYADAPRVFELIVSLVRAQDVVEEGDALARTAQPARLVLSVGRLDREKNPLLLLDVIAALHATDPAWRLVVVGEGPMRDEMHSRAQALGIGDIVEMRGYVPVDGGLAELYRECEVFLHVSWTEGVPQVLLEAFAAGLPVVATDVGGVALAAGSAAVLIPPGDADSAVRALEQVAADAGLRERLIHAGLARARETTLEMQARKLVDFMNQA